MSSMRFLLMNFYRMANSIAMILDQSLMTNLSTFNNTLINGIIICLDKSIFLRMNHFINKYTYEKYILTILYFRRAIGCYTFSFLFVGSIAPSYSSRWVFLTVYILCDCEGCPLQNNDHFSLYCITYFWEIYW